jgi:hypothetical protein
MRFEYDPAREAWVCTRDAKVELFPLLTNEVKKVTGADLPG